MHQVPQMKNRSNPFRYARRRENDLVIDFQWERRSTTFTTENHVSYRLIPGWATVTALGRAQNGS
jgi:hypothetical protein